MWSKHTSTRVPNINSNIKLHIKRHFFMRNEKGINFLFISLFSYYLKNKTKTNKTKKHISYMLLPFWNFCIRVWDQWLLRTTAYLNPRVYIQAVPLECEVPWNLAAGPLSVGLEKPAGGLLCHHLILPWVCY